MTGQERRAFQRLFDSVASSQKQAPKQAQSNTRDGDVLGVGTRFTPTNTTTSEYPSKLRAMAAEAQRAMEARRKQKAEDAERATEEGALEPEVLRIENLMYAAHTDAALWGVLTTEVLGPLEKLDAQIRQRDDSSFDQGSKRAKKSQVSQSLNTIAVGCSMLFALAMRLLSRRVVYSQYAEALLPTIKTHSWTTSILGISTPLYNEAVRHVWKTRQDLPAIMRLLQEMDEAALEVDSGTLEALEDVRRWITRAQRGDFGIGVQTLENLLERKDQVREFRQWVYEIRNRLDQMAVEKSQRAEAEKRLDLEGAFGDQSGT